MNTEPVQEQSVDHTSDAILSRPDRMQWETRAVIDIINSLLWHEYDFLFNPKTGKHGIVSESKQSELVRVQSESGDFGIGYQSALERNGWQLDPEQWIDRSRIASSDDRGSMAHIAIPAPRFQEGDVVLSTDNEPVEIVAWFYSPYNFNDLPDGICFSDVGFNYLVRWETSNGHGSEKYAYQIMPNHWLNCKVEEIKDAEAVLL